MNMLRTPLNGRTFEYFGEDPFLAARMAVGWTQGVQAQGVIANAKHYAVNNQEGAAPSPPGPPVGAGGVGNRLTVDARLDERTLREIYLPQFEAAVKEGGAGSVMCSYPRVNGQYACENSHLLEDVLKRDWDFKGFVLTDYGAAKNTVDSLNNGLDLDIWPARRLPAAARRTRRCASGQVVRGRRSTSTCAASCARCSRSGSSTATPTPTTRRRSTRTPTTRRPPTLEQQGIVLLKNERLAAAARRRQIGKVALIGPEADAIKDGGGSSAIDEFKPTTPRQALEAKLGAGRVAYDDGSDAAAAAAAARRAPRSRSSWSATR